ncbi:ribosomal subunit interface protein [candidate division WOR-3 bacterium RBG_13_43_14]|uniref:Ribosomal subunit interface protein n=1 Tax=candidate division WOR-3 bacterium RBG_13_43_14 TaxID=1802590 RepID=A0A1F4U919_UNCW3|nr:MAG: ribosomal subunit interface protein [candidate division WOR-3 bacterium RBG_13_43_14]
MNLKIAARNFALTDMIQEYANKKLQKLERFSHHIINGELVMEKDKALSMVELNLSVKHSLITSKVKTPDIYEGINDVFRKVERQLKKYEEKFRGRKRVMQKSKRL